MVLEYLSLYPWVKQEVLKEVSLYSETILLEAVKNDLIFTFNGKDENIIVESCVREELVCVHVILRFLLTMVQRGVLLGLNVAPTQLHPNSWAFV